MNLIVLMDRIEAPVWGDHLSRLTHLVEALAHVLGLLTEGRGHLLGGHGLRGGGEDLYYLGAVLGHAVLLRIPHEGPGGELGVPLEREFGGLLHVAPVNVQGRVVAATVALEDQEAVYP